MILIERISKNCIKKITHLFINKFILIYIKMILSLKAALIGVLLNIVLAIIATPLATENEVMPPNGAASLSFKSQVMHMLVHHNQVMLTSSLIVALLVGLSVCIAQKV